MKPILEHLRNLSEKHRDRIAKAEEIASKIKKAAEAARAAGREKAA